VLHSPHLFMRIIHAAFAIALTITPPHLTWAGEALSLYQAMEIVTGTDLRERPRGFAACLEDVLVKVSGDPRLRTDPRVAEMKLHAADYVRSFNYTDPIAGIRPHDDQGTYDRSEDLTVTFDPAKIDTLLASLGEEPWHGPRPVLLPVLSVHGRHDQAWLLAAGEPLAAEQRAAFQRIAAEAGLTVSFSAASEFPKWGVGLNAVVKTAPCAPRGMIVVTGTLDWSETTPGWVGTWRACWKGREHIWGIHGGGYDLAFTGIVQGAVLLAAGRGEPETEAR
jgi:hypothetical protein